MNGSLLNPEILPFCLTCAALVATAVPLDALLHLLDAGWTGRLLGIPRVLLIIVCC